MTMIRHFFLAAVLGLAHGSVDHFSWHDCGTDPNRPLKIYAVSVSPMPIIMPGTITISFNASLSKAIDSTLMDFDLRRHVPILGDVYIPCLFDVGSCDMEYCTILSRWKNHGGHLSRKISTQFTDMFTKNHLNMACPIQPQKLLVAPTSITIPDIGSLTSIIAAGDYTIKASIKDTHKAEVGCISMKVGLKSKSSGFLFGG